MKDLLIKLTILAIIAAIMCAGFIYLDNVIVANAQDAVICPYDDPYCYWTDPPPIEIPCEIPCIVLPYPAPVIEPTPYPAPLHFSFPSWLQVILDSIAAWL